ncbi:DgyrCDS9992 [Dimorphilus gyrociliatus]|uniref:DgyrCDS9992 n=1 Tax=Dimorphilus gyrociliatus TaxID=2664684 RepID=A0A7I8VYT9_9ANNE|nr:DgyrCDS9992 [Dimorphilus gyrociliatus]
MEFPKEEYITSDSDSKEEDPSVQQTPPLSLETTINCKGIASDSLSENLGKSDRPNMPKFMLTDEAKALLSGKSNIEKLFTDAEQFPDEDIKSKIRKVTRQSSYIAHRIFSTLHIKTSFDDFSLENFVSSDERETFKENNLIAKAKAEGRREAILAIAEELCKYEADQEKVYEFVYTEIERNQRLTNALEKIYGRYRKSISIVENMEESVGKDLIQENRTLKKELKEASDKVQKLQTELNNLKKGVQSAFEPPTKRRCIERFLPPSSYSISNTRVLNGINQQNGNSLISNLENEDEDDDVEIIGEEGFNKSISFKDLPVLRMTIKRAHENCNKTFKITWTYDKSDFKPVNIDSYQILGTLNGKNLTILHTLPAKQLPVTAYLKEIKTKMFVTVRAKSGSIVGPIARFQKINPHSF